MGEVFAGRYELLHPVAAGGMGSVWTVRDLKLDDVRAAKLLRQSDAGALLRFIREQSMRIDHAHVVTPQSWSGEDDRVLFTMPLIRGGSVATLVGDFGPLPIGWVVDLIDQTLQALEAVHGAGIVHRDVKPANLLLQPTGAGRPHLLLTDFGVAVAVDEPRLTRASQVFATPGYTPDDQLRGADPDPRQDLYSVGVTGLEMVSGLRPPAAYDAARTRAAEEPDIAPLVELLLRATSPEVDTRPDSAAAMRRELASLGRPRGQPTDGPFVFTHIEVDGSPASEPPASPAETDEARVASRPTASVVPVLTPRPTSAATTRPTSSQRAAALVLVVVALACLVGAAAILFG